MMTSLLLRVILILLLFSPLKFRDCSDLILDGLLSGILCAHGQGGTSNFDVFQKLLLLFVVFIGLLFVTLQFFFE